MNGRDNSFFHHIERACELLAGVAFAVLCLVVGLQVGSRYMFAISFDWAEELPLFLFLWVCFLAAAAAYRQDSHLGVSLLYDRLPQGARRVIRYVELLLCLIFFFILFYYELDVSLSILNTFVTLKFSKMYYYIGIPIGALALMIFVVEKIIKQVRSDSRGTAGPKE